MPQRVMRSPSVERLMFKSSAAFDLLPSATFSAQPIRFDSTSLSRSSREIDVTGAAAGNGDAPSALAAPKRMLTARQPTRTVPHEQV